MRSKYFFLPGFVGLFSLFSCSKPNNYSNINAEVVKEMTLHLTSANENHLTAGIVKSNDFHIKLFADKSIRFDILVSDLAAAGDGIKTIQINAGDPVTDGPLLLDLNPRLSGAYASGIVTGVRSSLFDSLLNENVDTYINLISIDAPTGLLRAPLNTQIVFAKNVTLSGSNVSPSVTTSSNGLAFIRVTSGQNLYSKIMVNNVETDDPVTSATINHGADGTNGAVITTLASSPAEFNAAKSLPLSEADFTSLLHTNTYVNVSSVLNASGKLRGQIQ